MEFSQTEQKLTLADMDDFERKIGLKLPQDFKEHYLKFNGGYPSFEYVKGLRNIFTINGFDSIKYGALPIEKLIDDFQKSGVNFNEPILTFRKQTRNYDFCGVKHKNLRPCL
ncbi:SMI1/KNR4 family protein [Capnocytophaga canis]|uniref:SMI1/KNR4 family protein n=1 Tax=Capnocytophaga canis TaxID=1848903 RepID=UPI0037D21256